MTEIPWKRRCKNVNGRLLQWAVQDLEGGCQLISIQNMDESQEMRFPPEDDFEPLARRKCRTQPASKEGSRHVSR